MKQFNTFAVNSNALSDYYSPKNSSQGAAFANSKYDQESRLKGTSILTEHFFKSNAFNDNHPKNKPQKYTNQYQYIQNPTQTIPQEAAEENQDNFETHLSLMIDNVSLPQFNRIEFTQQKLFTLQNNVTQHLLELREQKIIMMQEFSKIIDNKNLFQYYLLRFNLEKEEMETNLDSPVRYDLDQVGHEQDEENAPIVVSAPILKENEDLHLRLKELQIKEEIFGSAIHDEQNNEQSQQIINEIIQVRQMISKLQNQASVKNKLKNNESQQSRFITFLPQDRQKHFQSTVKSSSQEQYKELRERLNKLKALNETHRYKLTIEEVRYCQELKKENRRLIDEVEQMISGKRGEQPQRIAQLKSFIQENQHEKEVFLEQLEKFKEVMRNAKNENKRLKYQLNI